MAKQNYIKVTEAAEILGVTERTVRNLIVTDQMEASKDDAGMWQITKGELRRVKAERNAKAKAAEKARKTKEKEKAKKAKKGGKK